MKTVQLLHDTIVRFEKGSVVTVSDAEAARLIAFNNAIEAKKKAETKPAKKK